MSALSITSIIFIIICATFLVFHEKYTDGLLGRAGLCGMAFVSLLMGVERWAGQEHYLSDLTVWFQASVAVFFVRHTYNFILWAHFNRGAWKEASRDHS